MATWLYRIGEAAARRAWTVILIWALIIAGVAGAYTAFHGKLSNTFTMPGTQTQQLSDELAQRFPSAFLLRQHHHHRGWAGAYILQHPLR